MNVLIISDSEHSSFETNMRSTFSDAGIKITNISYIKEGSFDSKESKVKLRKADLLLAVIDSNFLKNQSLALEFGKFIESNNLLAKITAQIVLIVVGDTSIPFDINATPCIACESCEKIVQLPVLILNIINAKNYRVGFNGGNINRKDYFHIDSIRRILVRAFIGYFLAKFFIAVVLQTVYDSFSPHLLNGRSEHFVELLFYGASSLASLIPYAIFFITVLSIIPEIYNIIEGKKHYSENDSYSDQLAHAIGLEDSGSDTKEKKFDALGLMWNNLLGIDKFYKWSRTQAVLSFGVAITTFLLGFGLIIIASKTALDPNANTQMTVIPIIGAAITEFISATTLFVYQKSISQLNYYHKSLHENERFLSSVNLIDRFHKDDVQDTILQEIIRNQMQMNVFDLHELFDNKDSGKVLGSNRSNSDETSGDTIE